MSRNHSISELYAYVQHFGCPSWFLTISPDDTHDTLVIRMSHPTKEGLHVFPTENNGLDQALRQGDTVFEQAIDISEYGLAKILADNPVAAAKQFKEILDSLYEVLFGISPAYKIRSSVAARSRNKGVFGQTFAVYNCIEVQGRLSLHGHMVIWAGLPPWLLQSCALVPNVVAAIKTVLSSQCKAALENLPATNLHLVPAKHPQLEMPVT